MRRQTTLLGAAALLLLACSGCNGGAGKPSPAAGSPDARSGQETSPATSAQQPVPRVEEDPQDSIIFEQRMAQAKRERMDTLPIGEIVVRMGRTFVGAPYVPGSLEAPGDEHLVVNLRSFDCVTFVENSLALARTAKARGNYAQFKRELMGIRYRDGRLVDYPSRLHYFSDWIANNDAKGIVRNVTRELGGVPDPEPISFMTSHVKSYRQLQDSTFLRAIAATEQRLSREGRVMIPEDAIASAAPNIRNGDVIGAATTVAGLDIAHTGIALWVDGELRLMHAPLVGTMVQISGNSLASRIKAAPTQDGIMVARPR
jgi:hypothetical protein